MFFPYPFLRPFLEGPSTRLSSRVRFWSEIRFSRVPKSADTGRCHGVIRLNKAESRCPLTPRRPSGRSNCRPKSIKIDFFRHQILASFSTCLFSGIFVFFDVFWHPFWLHFCIICHTFCMPFSSIDFASIFD